MKWRKSLKAEDGKVTQVITYENDKVVEFPLAKNGEIRWFDDEKLRRKIS